MYKNERRGLLPSDDRKFRGTIKIEFRLNLLILRFLENKPAIVPTSRALRIADYHPLCLVQTLRAERIALRDGPEFAQEVVRVDEMRPCVGHWGDSIR